jgi:hypothetical protein
LIKRVFDFPYTGNKEENHSTEGFNSSDSRRIRQIENQKLVIPFLEMDPLFHLGSSEERDKQ